MRITCDREPLLSAFQTAAMVAPSRSPKPILQNIKLEVTDSGAIVMATDMEVGVRIEVPGIQVDALGSALFPVSRFGSILRESSDEKLAIEVDAAGVRVRGERSEFKLSGGNPDEFPSVVSFAEEKYHKLPARLFKELIRRTLFATDTESSRYALGGVLLEMEPNRITGVGTDGRRLAKMEGPAEAVNGHVSGETMTIVPARSMQLIERSLSDLEAEVWVAARANDILVKSPTATIYSRLVEGRFPRWRDVFPGRQNAIRIELTVGPMYSALRQASVVSDEDSRGIDFAFGEGKLVLTAVTAEVGTSRVELPIPYDGQPVTVTMDHRFVADFLRVLEPEQLFTVEIENDESAAVFGTDDGYGYVVMPLARDRH
jgi:DNA polymerase-3 subunit beta